MMKHRRCGGLFPVVKEPFSNQDILNRLRDASLILSSNSGLMEALPLFLPTSTVISGTTRYSLPLVPEKEYKNNTGNSTTIIEADGVLLSYSSRILYKQQKQQEEEGEMKLLCRLVTPLAYGTVPPSPPAPHISQTL
ncbi:hypothetical protein LSM04_009466 [Trypanosoma melophagium]|uniref:uncharacterized protein n=1 Tax=Trypanosoma melophagium TaxID=715481 RepID=UPI00351AA4EE|nr:hypothetical protein LSM04_009466 [Trypanosoma melophagium]